MLFLRVGGNMRILAVLFIGLLSVGARAEGPSPIFPDCVALVQVIEGKQSQAVYGGGRCLGFIEALLPALHGIHQHYEIAFPNLKYPFDEVTLKRYMASTVTVGQDVCLAGNVSPYIAAKIISKYGTDHPEYLTLPFWDFASSALQSAYPCDRPH
jgi:Rap1a immunity proteins